MEIICSKCEHLSEVEDATKKHRHSISLSSYENLVSNPSLIIALLGCQSATVGLVWLVVTRVLANKN